MQAKRERLPAPEEWMKDLLVYKDGELYWSKHEANKKKNFKDLPIGEKNAGDYKLIKLNGRNYSLHRVIYWMFTGEWPEIVEHIDGDLLNNRFENLRPKTYKEKTKYISKVNRGTIKEHVNDDGSISYDVTMSLHGVVSYIGSYRDRIDALYATWRVRELLNPDSAIFPVSTIEEQRAVCAKFKCSIRVRK